MKCVEIIGAGGKGSQGRENAGGMGRSLTAHIEGPLSEVGPLRAKWTSHSAR
jgi:hypothetical protein